MFFSNSNHPAVNRGKILTLYILNTTIISNSKRLNKIIKLVYLRISLKLEANQTRIYCATQDKVFVQSFTFIVNESVQEKAFTTTEIHYKSTPYEKPF